MELFFAQVRGNIVTLSTEESKHCIKVLRHRRGDKINLIDGMGTMYEATIIDPDPHATVVQVFSRHEGFGRVPYHLAMALSPLKNNARYEWFVEKATEIGITELIPVLTRYTEKAKIKRERLEKILISAAKQSLRAQLPVLEDLTQFDSLINRDYDQKFIALCDASTPLLSVYSKGLTTMILVGPEGGFSEEEKNKALDKGFVPVKIGDSRLRAETAAVVAASVISNLNIV
jgi:16S rRNA (uracil1498-N3)-methyltransferase